MTNMILPLNNFKGNSEGENIIWQKFRDFLPADFVSFHNYYLGLKQADVILFVPKRGILIIEIKGFLAKNIIDVPDRTIIRVKNQPPEPSPFEQAIKYRNILLGEFLSLNGINSVYTTCAVCYPFISKEECRNKGLNKISHERLTITIEDLASADNLLLKIEDIFNHTYESVSVPTLVKYGFENVLFEKAANIISPDFRNNQTDNIEKKASTDEDDTYIREVYSRFIYVKSTTVFDDSKIDILIKDWLSGAKIYFYSDNQALVSNILKKLDTQIIIRELSDRKAFKINDGNTFLFSAGVAPTLDHDIHIVNGENFENHKKEFEILHNNSSFNKDQYEIEHAPLTDIIVKAGAGTGKTYSIVSRINYLVWKNEYAPSDLKSAIAMITFTNESADAMKEKLSDNFLNHYLLTKDTIFLEMVESVEDMNISTIHSMSRKVLQKFSSKIGLGKDFKIVTGDYKRGQILHSKLNEYVEAHPDFENKVDISMFQLGARLISFLERLDNKNVDIVTDRYTLKFGKATNTVFDDLIKVICDAQREMNNYCKNNNSVSLGDLIRKLRTLYDKLEASKLPTTDKIDFLFVDEFQDTDDVQIELMKKFREVFGYNFFVVGDIKQCIYRFRGAEVKAFDTLTKGQSDMRVISLNKNYRTDTQLMEKLNTIFTLWNDKDDLEYADDDILIGTKNYCSSPEVFGLPFESTQMFEKKLISSINRLKEKLEGEKDKIAILVRYNWQIAEIREMCERNQINVETEIGGELFRIDPTIDLFKLILALKFNQSPKYIYNLYTTSYISDDVPKISLWSKKDTEITEYFYGNLPVKLNKWKEYIERMRTEPILKVIRDIVDDVKPWEIFAKKIGAIGVDVERGESYYIRNLDQLFEKLILASNTDYLTINKLSDYLEIMILTRREEEARESYDVENSKAQVICTTVHKSKGLEFDTIILPYCDFDISSARVKGDVDLIYSGNEVGYRVMGNNYKSVFENDLYKRFQKDELIDRKREETRILYVALTRAIKRIVYFSDNTGSRKHANCWDNMIKGGER